MQWWTSNLDMPMFMKNEITGNILIICCMTPENIANFICKNAYIADKIILTDMCDRLIVESIYGGFIMNCPNQELCQKIIHNRAPIQQCEIESKDFHVATRDEMEELWYEEEIFVMEAEISML